MQGGRAADCGLAVGLVPVAAMSTAATARSVVSAGRCSVPADMLLEARWKYSKAPEVDMAGNGIVTPD